MDATAPLPAALTIFHANRQSYLSDSASSSASSGTGTMPTTEPTPSPVSDILASPSSLFLAPASPQTQSPLMRSPSEVSPAWHRIGGVTSGVGWSDVGWKWRTGARLWLIMQILHKVLMSSGAEDLPALARAAKTCRELRSFIYEVSYGVLTPLKPNRRTQTRRYGAISTCNGMTIPGLPAHSSSPGMDFTGRDECKIGSLWVGCSGSGQRRDMTSW